MKTQNEKTIELIENNDTKSIQNNISNWTLNRDKRDNLIGDTLIELIAEHSKDSDLRAIATRCIDADIMPSNEDAGLLTFEVQNNKSYYLDLMADFNGTCRSDAFDVLREIYPNKSDAEIKSMIG